MSVRIHTPASSNMCCYDVMMSDSYGDGWNNASLDHYQDGQLIQTSTLSSGMSGLDMVCLNNGSNYRDDF